MVAIIRVEHVSIVCSSSTERLQEYVEWFRQRFVNDISAVVSQKIPSISKPGSMGTILNELVEISEAIHHYRPTGLISLDKRLLPCLKTVVLTRRRDEAESIEIDKSKTHNPDILQSLDERLSKLDDLLREDWLIDIEPKQLPSLLDYLSLEEIEKLTWNQMKLAEREYDEKFHLLQAPRLFFDDLNYFRMKCENRGTALAVVYLDIDDFKLRFNKKYGEVEVDRRVLPRFMQALEAHVFQHGFAYREGGDEYLALLPNVPFQLAVNFLELLRIGLERLEYRDADEKTTVSIGFCHVTPNCFLTNQEVKRKANDAKNFAKANGKNCIATFLGNR